MGNEQYISLLKTSEYQHRILKCITSDEIDKYFNCSGFKDKPECKQAMIYGMCIASILTSDCTNIVAIGNLEEDK